MYRLKLESKFGDIGINISNRAKLSSRSIEILELNFGSILGPTLYRGSICINFGLVP